MDQEQRKKVEALLARAELDSADQLVTGALAKDPRDPDALVFRARLTAFKGELDGAMFVVERALKTHPQHVDGRATRAALLLEKGKVAEGKQLLLGVVASKDAPASACLNLGRILLDERDFQGARRHLEAALAKEPESGFVRYSLAEACAELNDHARAVELLEHALKRDPSFGDAWHLLARVQLALEHEGDAIKNLEEGLKHAEQHPRLRELLASTLLLAGEIDRAGPLFSALVKDFPDDVVFMQHLGLCYAAKGRLADAEEVFRRALRVEPSNPELKTQLAALLEDKPGRDGLKEAVRLLREAVRTDDAGWEPFNDLGRILSTRQEVLDVERAIELLERARKKARGSPEPDLNLAIAYARAGRAAPLEEMCALVEENPRATEEMKAEVRRLLAGVTS